VAVKFNELVRKDMDVMTHALIIVFYGIKNAINRPYKAKCACLVKFKQSFLHFNGALK